MGEWGEGERDGGKMLGHWPELVELREECGFLVLICNNRMTATVTAPVTCLR